jgi:hypothetical protein
MKSIDSSGIYPRSVAEVKKNRGQVKYLLFQYTLIHPGNSNRYPYLNPSMLNKLPDTNTMFIRAR